MSSYDSKPQPPPQPSDSPAVWPLVIKDVQLALDADARLVDRLVADMRRRDMLGRKKYGVPLRVDSDRQADVDAYEEALDFCVYARQQAERTNSTFWHSMSGRAVGLAAGILADIMRRESGL